MQTNLTTMTTTMQRHRRFQLCQGNDDFGCDEAIACCEYDAVGCIASNPLQLVVMGRVLA